MAPDCAAAIGAIAGHVDSYEDCAFDWDGGAVVGVEVRHVDECIDSGQPLWELDHD